MSKYRKSSTAMFAHLLSIPYKEAKVVFKYQITKFGNSKRNPFDFHDSIHGKRFKESAIQRICGIYDGDTVAEDRRYEVYLFEQVLVQLGFSCLDFVTSTNIEQVMSRLGAREPINATYNQWIEDRKKENSKEKYAVLLIKRSKPFTAYLKEWVLVEGDKLANYVEPPSFLEEYSLQHWRVEAAFQITKRS